ncbi:MAG TPA: DHA2 family efflux MFS transporter permease subunit [Acidimicrobiia bacterium]|nr:DHA2 family efflux MFS transporter permease subunit [Acidimicrobiia bacterium]
MTSPVHGPLSDTDPKVHARRWWILGVLCLSLVIVFVGNTSLNVVIPTLSRDLGATDSQLQWIVAVYSLVFAGLLFTSGALGDRFGRKGAMQFGLVVFLVGTLAGALATSMAQLIATRALMGVGAAFIMPSTLSILVNVFNDDERERAIAIWASLVGAAAIIGSVASGWLIDHFWYGSVFLVNVPFVIAALILGFVLLPKSRDPEEAPLDPVGAVLSIIGITALVYGLIEGPDKGWTSTVTLVSFGIAVVGIALFAAWELHHDEPMLDMHYFRNPAFSTGTGGMILVFLALSGVFFLMTQYFQLVLGYSALSASVRFMPVALIILLLSPRTPWFTNRFGVRATVTAGLALVACSLLMILALHVDADYWQALLTIVPLAVGLSLSMSPMTASIMSAVPDRRAGAGSATNDATRELGAALGVAILGSIAASVYRSSLSPTMKTLPASIDERAGSSLAGAAQAATGLSSADAQTLIVHAKEAFVDSMHVAALVGGVLAIIAVVAAFRFLPRELPEEEGALSGPLHSFEASMELFGGMLPATVDDLHRAEQVPADLDALPEDRPA